QWFDRSRGKAMGFAYLGIGIGGAAVPLLSVWLTQMFGWRTALEVLGIVIIVISLPLVLLVKEKSLPTPRQSHSRALESTGDCFRNPAFYLLAFGSMCSIGAVGGANQHLKLFLSLDQHYAADEAAQIISLVLVFSIAGRLLMGWLADRVPKKNVMLL